MCFDLENSNQIIKYLKDMVQLLQYLIYLNNQSNYFSSPIKINHMFRGSSHHIQWHQQINYQQVSQNNQQEIVSLDHFVKFFEQQIIMQWNQGTIQFPTLLPVLKYCYKFYQKNHQDFVQGPFQYITFLPLGQLQKQKIANIDKVIKKFVEIGYNKYKAFLQYRTSRNQFHWQNLCKIMNELSAIQIRSHQDCSKRHYLKDILKIIYSEVVCLRLFIKINEVCFQYIAQFRKKYIKAFLSDQRTIKKAQRLMPVKKYSFQLQEKQKSEDIINFLQQSCKHVYGQLVYMNQSKKQRLETLSTIHQTKKAKHKDYFLIGLFLGLGGVVVLIMLGLLVSNIIYIHSQSDKIDSLVYIFPIFRGVGLLILYFWGNAWNVYGFNKNRINYQLVLDYGSHYSTYEQIIKRAGFFTLIFISMLLLYFIGVQISNSYNIYLPVEYTPFVVWIIFLGYIFFPNRDVFNPRGRKYFYKILKSIIYSPFIKMTFLISWVTDQTVSFVVPIKDMAYSICFYTSDFSVSSVQNCLKSAHLQGFIVTYIVALIPIIFRMIQCYRQAVQSSGKFFGHLQMWNFFKYFSSFVTVTISFLSSFFGFLFYPFIASSIVSTLYAYYWDLKYDWGFLEPNSKYKFLRNQLSFKNKSYYYIAICINLIFRCSWTLTISPSIINILPKATFLPFVTGLIEIFRRCMWNFFRIEKQHVANCQNYRITNDASEIFKKIDQNHDFVQDSQDNLMNALIDADSFLYAQPAADKLLKKNSGEELTQEDIDKKKQQFQQKVLEQQQYWNTLKKTKQFMTILRQN